MSEIRHRYVSSDRRVREDRRFVVGKGQFVADIDALADLHASAKYRRRVAAHLAARAVADARATALGELAQGGKARAH